MDPSPLSPLGAARGEVAVAAPKMPMKSTLVTRHCNQACAFWPKGITRQPSALGESPAVSTGSGQTSYGPRTRLCRIVNARNEPSPQLMLKRHVRRLGDANAALHPLNGGLDYRQGPWQR